MGKFRVTSPDGQVFEVNAPEGATQEQVLAYAQGEFANQKPAITKPASVQAGEFLGGIPRQIGLTARYGAEGLAQLADIGAEPIRQLIVNPLARLVGSEGADRPFSQVVSEGMDKIGLPSPQGADERVVGDVTRLMAGAGGMGAAARGGAQITTGVAKNALQSLGANQAQQLVGAAGAGAAGGSVREAGGGPWEQFVAALVGGVATPMAGNALAGAAQKGANAVTRALTPQTVIDQRVDQQITLALNRSGMDWSQVPERIKQGLRGEVAAALETGQPINADALRRLMVFKRTDTVPTVGQLTQDPGQITREANLAKTGANSTDPALQRLPSLQNQNTRTLLEGLDTAGARGAPTAADASRRAIESLDSNLASAGAARDALYKAARDSQGRSVVLDGPAAAQAAARQLKADLVGKLPPEVDDIINNLTTGKTPLTVEYQQQLVKDLYAKMRRAGDNGDLRHGLKIVRDALDNADVLPAPKVNPGNLPAVAGSVPASPLQAGPDAIAAFKEARNAHRELMARIEANPALRAVSEGVEPDQFVQKFVIGNSASARDVQALRNELSPEATQGMRQYLVRYLKDKATGGDEDVTKFAGKTYRDTFRALQEKLPAFFSQDEIQKMRDIGDAAKYMQAQPAGAAVNNSNSGALMLGRGLDVLDKIAGYIPLGGKDVIKGTIQGIQQRQVMAPANALKTLAAPQPRSNPLLALPLVAAGQRSEDR